MTSSAGARTSRTSREYLDSFPRQRTTRGVVVGFGREAHIVRVLRDGLKAADSYHMDYWDPAGGDTEQVVRNAVSGCPVRGTSVMSPFPKLLSDSECDELIERASVRIAAWREGNRLARERERNRVALAALIRDRERRAAGMSWAGAWKSQILERV